MASPHSSAATSSAPPLVPIAASASHSASVRDTRGTAPGGGSTDSSPPSTEKPWDAAPPRSAVTAGPVRPCPAGTWSGCTGRSQAGAVVLAGVISPPPATAAQMQPLTAATAATTKAATTDPRVHRMRFRRSSRYRGSLRGRQGSARSPRAPAGPGVSFADGPARAPQPSPAGAWINVAINHERPELKWPNSDLHRLDTSTRTFSRMQPRPQHLNSLFIPTRKEAV